MVYLQFPVQPTYHLPPLFPGHRNEPDEVAYHQCQPGSALMIKHHRAGACISLVVILYQYLNSHLSFLILGEKQKAALYIRSRMHIPLDR